MTDTTPMKRDPVTGQFAKGNPGGPGAPPREQDQRYRSAILRTCSPEQFAQVIEQAKNDALDKRSWKNRNAARTFLVKVLVRAGVLGELVGRQQNNLIFGDSKEIQQAIAERLQVLLGGSGNGEQNVIEAEAVEAAPDVQ